MQSFIKIFHSVQEIGPFSLFHNVISQSIGLDRVNVNVYAKVYKNMPLSPRDRTIFIFSEFELRQEIGLFSFFQNLNSGYASANPK